MAIHRLWRICPTPGSTLAEDKASFVTLRRSGFVAFVDQCHNVPKIESWCASTAVYSFVAKDFPIPVPHGPPIVCGHMVHDPCLPRDAQSVDVLRTTLRIVEGNVSCRDNSTGSVTGDHLHSLKQTGLWIDV